MAEPPVSRRELLAGAAALAALPATVAAPAERPNILVIMSDDHSAPHLGCHGADVRTPNLDRLAAAGLRGDRVYVCAPQCVPSRAGYLCGRSPIGIQMTRFSAPLPMDVRTYPELLRASGYFAGVAGRSFHLDGTGNAPETREALDRHQLRTFARRLDFVKTAGGRQQILAQYEEFLAAVPAGRPWYLQLCFSDPHRGWDDQHQLPPHDPAALKLPGHFPDTPLVREELARYYDEIARMDSDVGRVLAILEQRGLARNTLVLFTGDNGASQLRGKGTLYEFGIHVPLVIRWPGVIDPGRASDALISGEDLAPTLLAAAGLEPAPGMTGRSFLPLLRGDAGYTPRGHLFAERGAHGSGLPTNTAAFDLARCVVTPQHKLIYHALYQLPYHPVDFAGTPMWKDLQDRHAAGTLGEPFERLYFPPERGLFELYDLAADPFELSNLAGREEHRDLERRLKGLLHEWMLLERDYVPLPLP